MPPARGSEPDHAKNLSVTRHGHVLFHRGSMTVRRKDDESPRFTLELHGGGHLILIGHGSEAGGTYGSGHWDTATTVSARHLDLVRRAAGTGDSDSALLEALTEITGAGEDAETRFRGWLESHRVPFRRYPDWRRPVKGRRLDP